MKIVKKLFVALMLVLTLGTIVGCGLEDFDKEEALKPAVDSIIFDADLNRFQTAATLPTTTPKFELNIEWSIKVEDKDPTGNNDPEFVAKSVELKTVDGVSTLINTIATDEDEQTNLWGKATLTATVTNKKGSITRDWDVWAIEQPYVASTTIASLKAMANGSNVSVTATVSWVKLSNSGTALNIMLLDPTTGDGVYVYKAEGTCNIGDVVTVSGMKTTYAADGEHAMPQITSETTSNPCTVTVKTEGTGSYDYSNVITTVTVDELSKLAVSDAIYGKVFRITGVLKTNDDTNTPYVMFETTNEATVLNVTKYGFNKQDKSVDTTLNTQITEKLGKKVTLTAALYNNYHGVWNILIINDSIELVGDGSYTLTDAEKLANAETYLSEFEDLVVGADLELPTTYNDVAIAWSSNNVEVLANDGTITPTDNNESVELTATLTIGELTKTLIFNVTVKSAKLDSILDAVKAQKGSIVSVKGYVTGICTRGFILTDDTASILVYIGNTFDISSVQIGQERIIRNATTAAFNGQPQLTVVGEATDETKEVKYNPLEVTAAMLDEMAANGVSQATYVRITGKVAKNGNNTNILLDGATKGQGSVYYYDKETFTIEDGADYVFEGFVNGVSSGKYVNIIVTNVTPVDEFTAPVSAHPISAALAANKDDQVTVEGWVVAIHAKGFVLADATDAILVFVNKGFSTDSVKVGEYRTITSKLDIYKGTYEILNIGEVTAVGVTHALTPEVLDGAKFDEYTNAGITGCKYVQYTGTVVASGNYKNIAVEGANRQASAYQITTSYNLEVGKTYVVTGWFVGVSISGENRFFNTVLTSLVEAEAPLSAEE